MTEVNIKDIRTSYGVDRPNDSFINDIVCNICDDNIFEVQGISLDFCETPKERYFWKRNILNKYAYLFPYLVINKWQINDPTNEEIAKWIECFLEEKVIDEKGKTFGDKLYEEIIIFKNDTSILKEIPNIIPEVGFIIDCYLWIYYKETPFFVGFVKENMPEAEIPYDKYYTFFGNSLEPCNFCFINDNINKLLDYCKLTDLVVGKQDCYKSLISHLSIMEGTDIGLLQTLKYISHDRCDFFTFREIIGYYCLYCSTLNEYSSPSISFCHKNDEINFWNNNKDRYYFLLIYCVVKEWSKESQQSEELRYWCDLFTNSENAVRLESEIDLLKKEISNHSQDIPSSIIYNIGFIIDSYWWRKEMAKPILIKQVKRLENTTTISETLYDNYCELFIQATNQIDTVSLISYLDKMLDYCIAVDLLYSRSRCFRNLLFMLCNTSTNEDIPDILKKITSNNGNIYNYKILYKLFDYYYYKYLGFNKLTKKDIKDIGLIKKNLYKIRIDDYINRFEQFLDLQFTEERLPPLGGYESLYKNNLQIWCDCVEPWNFFDYYRHTNLYEIHKIVEEFRPKVIECLQNVCDSVINQAEKGEHNQDWAIVRAEELSENELRRLFMEVLEIIKTHLQNYKKDIIKQCANIAAKECDFNQVHTKVAIKELSTSTEEKAKISVKNSDIEISDIIYYFQTDWMSSFQRLHAIKPTAFIKKYISGHRFWGDWDSCYFHDSNYLSCINAISVFFVQIERILLDSTIYYLDGKFIRSVPERISAQVTIIENTEKEAIQKWLKEKDFFKEKIN